MGKGYLAIILHAHLPFVRHPEHAYSLEENWLYEAITETYVPLLMMMDRLDEDGVDYKVTFSLTPTLASMLLDPFLCSRYIGRMERLIELAGKEVQRTRKISGMNELARMYRSRFISVLDAFSVRYRQNLIAAFRRLQDSGKVEIIASCATHGYLPLLALHPPSVRAQVCVGVAHYQEVFGRLPRGFWLPECGFSPGVDTFLNESSIGYTILETHGLVRAHPQPSFGVYAPIHSSSGVSFFARDPECSRQVWSATEGYPGDFDYREFYRDIGHELDMDYVGPYIHPDGIRVDTGIKYYRVTGRGNVKELYCPEIADRKACGHAANFMLNRVSQIEHLASVMDRKPVVVAPYDAELFGHWWYEGPIWLEHLFRKFHAEQRDKKTIRLITLSEYLDEYPESLAAQPSTSSWGNKGYHETWLNSSNDWIYRYLQKGSRRLERLVNDCRGASGLQRRAVEQAARELLLAQASDWAFMISSNTMPSYGTQRTKSHLARLHQLAGQIEAGNIDETLVATLEAQDNIFPNIDNCIFQ